MDFVFLSDTVLFRGMRPPDVEAMLECLGARQRSYEKGELIHHAGDIIQTMGLVLSGSVHIENDGLWGNKDILNLSLIRIYRTLGNIAGFLQQAEQPDMLDSQLTNYGQMDEGVSLYREDGVCLPSGTQADETVALALMDNDKAYGVLDPHISSVTGVNVFNLFIRVFMADGSTAYLVKEYEVGAIVDTFTLSFYQNSGFSYVVDVDGNVLVRPPHPDSNKTVQNLFDMLRESDNEEDSLQLFMESLAGAKTGWAVLSYQGEQTVFCYIPLKLGTDWHLISIIPYGVVSAQTDQIIRQTLTLIAAIIMGCLLYTSMRLTGATIRRRPC